MFRQSREPKVEWETGEERDTLTMDMTFGESVAGGQGHDCGQDGPAASRLMHAFGNRSRGPDGWGLAGTYYLDV